MRRIVLLSFLLSSLSIAQPTRGWLTVDTLMRDPSWMGVSPSGVFWSEDGDWVYFMWRTGSDAGDSLYKASASGGAPQRVPIEERRSLPARSGDRTRDGKRFTFEKDGDLFVLDIRRHLTQRLTQTVAAESHPLFTQDEQAITFERDGNLFRRDLTTGLELQLTNYVSGTAPRQAQSTAAEQALEREQLRLFDVLRKRKGERDASRALRELLAQRPLRPQYLGQKHAVQPGLTPDGRFVTFITVERPAGVKQTAVPAYVTESGFTEDLPGRTKVGEPQSTYQLCVLDIARDTVLTVSPDSLPGLVRASGDTSASRRTKPRAVSYTAPQWSDDGRYGFVQVFSQDNKDRWIVLLDPANARFTAVLDRQTDSAWIGGPGISGWEGAQGWMPDSRTVWFQSEADGWSHLYTVGVDGTGKKQLTAGRFEVYRPMISRDKKRWYFTSNEVHLGERQVYSMPLAGGPRTRITSMEGRNDAFFSPDEGRIALLSSFSNRMPELYIMPNSPGANARQITDSPSKEFRAYAWRAPDLVTIPTRDGAQVPARLYRPEHPNGAAVIFVHGAGYLQNAHKWWSDYYHEYMFHNLLADRGYTVLDADYRASAGYGRDWRTAIYRHMGGKDLDDQVDGACWLVEHERIDSTRIGIYGGSYGGFITQMAMFTRPGVFAAGAALRSVTDWAHYNHGYTSDILNVPQDDSAAYRLSSPIYFAEGLRGALLICHGIMDENVHVQDDIRLVQRLIELKKDNWEFAVYPVEDHGFVEPTSWRDEYSRILKLFERELRK